MHQPSSFSRLRTRLEWDSPWDCREVSDETVWRIRLLNALTFETSIISYCFITSHDIRSDQIRSYHIISHHIIVYHTSICNMCIHLAMENSLLELFQDASCHSIAKFKSLILSPTKKSFHVFKLKSSQFQRMKWHEPMKDSILRGYGRQRSAASGRDKDGYSRTHCKARRRYTRGCRSVDSYLKWRGSWGVDFEKSEVKIF